MADISNAIEVYHLDHGSYPLAAFYTYNHDTQQTKPSQIAQFFDISSVFAAGTSTSTLAAISDKLTPYLKSLPEDPNGQGLDVLADGVCTKSGKYFSYYTDASGSMYAMTSLKESKK